jgi:hypothetical protein
MRSLIHRILNAAIVSHAGDIILFFIALGLLVYAGALLDAHANLGHWVTRDEFKSEVWQELQTHRIMATVIDANRRRSEKNATDIADLRKQIALLADDSEDLNTEIKDFLGDGRITRQIAADLQHKQNELEARLWAIEADQKYLDDKVQQPHQ